MYFKYILV